MATKVIHGVLYTPMKNDGTRDEVRLVTNIEDVLVDESKNLKDRLEEIETLITNSDLEGIGETLTSLKENKADKMHSSNDLTFGGATDAKYGHVKLSDTYKSAVPNGDALHSIGASQKSLNSAYEDLKQLIDTSAGGPHASEDGKYGLGDATHFGHVKLSDNYSTSDSNAAAVNGVGVSQNALANAYKALKQMIDTVGNGLTPDQVEKIQALLDTNPISIKIAPSQPNITGIWANSGVQLGDKVISE